MSATESVKQANAPVDARAYEPSMEEILASIRRIIADDQSLTTRAAVREEEVSLRAALEAVPQHREEVSPVEPELPVPEAAAPVEAPSDRAAVSESPLTRRPAPPAAEAPAPRPVTMAPRFTSATSHGPIAAPQFATPEGPAPLAEAGSEAEALPPRSTGPVHPAAMRDASAPSAPAQFVRVEAPAAVQDRAPSAPRPAEGQSASPRDLEKGLGASGPFRLRTSSEPVAAEEAGADLFSSTTSQTVSAAFNTLAATRLIENDAVLKDMVRDMMRPMLKAWLDDNLPALVERLVRAEIERVARGGR